MNDPILVKHARGAPGLRILGIGPCFIPLKGIEKLQNLFNENTSWAKKRSKNSIKQMLSKSDIVVTLWQKKEIIGFGRATSDETFRAVLWDVVVDKKYQNCGLGKKIVNSILNNSRVKNVEIVYLMTTYCEQFYNNIGFINEKKIKLLSLKKNERK